MMRTALTVVATALFTAGLCAWVGLELDLDRGPSSHDLRAVLEQRQEDYLRGPEPTVH